MATTVKPFTGRQCTLTIGSTDYSNVVQSFSIKSESEKLNYAVQGGDGVLAANGPTTRTLSITFANDISDQAGLVQALWTAAKSDGTIDFVASFNGVEYSGTAVADYPELSADASSIAGTRVDLEITGNLTGPTPATKSAPAGK